VTLRTRIAITAAAAVAVAFLVAAGGLYAETARTLRGEVDRSLTRIARDQIDHPARPRLGRVPFGPRAGAYGGAGGFVQYVDSDGQVLGVAGADPLPHDDEVRAVAAGGSDSFFATLHVDGAPVRVLTIPALPGVAAQIARPLDEIEASLAALRNRLALGGVLAIALAAGLGMIVARRAVQPVRRLTAVAEQVAATGDLTRRIELPEHRDDGAARDELDRLAHTFNVMLGNLEQARLAQQQLVADASHELRTPLTSLRTNIEVLALDAAAHGMAVGAQERLSAPDRRRLLDDLSVQLDEFGRLVSALVELARGAQPAQATTPVPLDELVELAVARARTFAGEAQDITVTAEPVVVRAESDRLERAVANLLDNAIKYGGGAPIAVAVRRHELAGGGRARRATATVSVRDEGPGIDADHLPHVFDRFYRAPAARGIPGSGLGLSIVKQVAEAHGGRVRAASADGGGTEMTLELHADPAVA
jgi:two-component system sensor histidine kinase MprB